MLAGEQGVTRFAASASGPALIASGTEEKVEVFRAVDPYLFILDNRFYQEYLVDETITADAD